MSEIEIGSVVEIEELGRIFKVYGFTKGRAFIPDGWLLDQMGVAYSPKGCKLVEKKDAKP